MFLLHFLELFLLVVDAETTPTILGPEVERSMFEKGYI